MEIKAQEEKERLAEEEERLEHEKLKKFMEMQEAIEEQKR